MAVPTFVTAGSYTSSASAATLTPALPATITVNNILISVCFVKATGKTVTTATAGWTVGDSINTGNVSAAWAWALALGSGLDAAAVWTWTGAAACSGQEIQYSGNAVVSPINTMNSATANASIAETIAALTTSAGNCAILDLLSASSAQTIPVPTNFTSRATTAGANGSIRMADAALLAAGTSLAQSVAITSADWSSFGIAILGSGSGVAAAHSSQVPEQVLYNYSDPTILHVSQVVIQVLRTVTTQTGHVRFNMPMMGR